MIEKCEKSFESVFQSAKICSNIISILLRVYCCLYFACVYIFMKSSFGGHFHALVCRTVVYFRPVFFYPCHPSLAHRAATSFKMLSVL